MKEIEKTYCPYRLALRKHKEGKTYREYLSFLNETLESAKQKGRIDVIVSEIEIVQARIEYENDINQLKAQEESSISITAFKEELLRLPPEMRYNMFSQLNALLIGEPAWIKNAIEIRTAVLKPQDNNINISVSKQNVNIGTVNNLNNNGILNDMEGAYILPQIKNESGNTLPFKINDA